VTQPIAVLMANTRDRDLLTEALHTVGHATIEGLTPHSDTQINEVSLVLADENMARRHYPSLLALRARYPDRLIPALVLLPGRAESNAWLRYGFNHALYMPLKKREFLSHIETFLAFKSQSEAALREAAVRNRAILDLAPDALVVLDERGFIIDLNHAAEQTFGYTHDDAAGRNFLELFIPPKAWAKYRTRFAAYVREAPAHVGRARFETTLTGARLRLFPAQVNVMRIDLHGRVRVAAFIQDLSS